MHAWLLRAWHWSEAGEILLLKGAVSGAGSAGGAAAEEQPQAALHHPQRRQRSPAPGQPH